MDDLLQTIYDAVIDGDGNEVQVGVLRAIKANMPPGRVLNEGLISAMTEVGARFEREEFYVPEMLVAARAMQVGLTLLKPHLVEAGVPATGKIVLGTVKGDLHDIGKNLVGMMLEGAGWEVIDLGADVGPEKFADAVRAHKADLVGMSALLTTTMPGMKSTVEALEDMGVRHQVKVIIGGAPVTEAFAAEIGADGYASDASRAVVLAKGLLSGSAGR